MIRRNACLIEHLVHLGKGQLVAGCKARIGLIDFLIGNTDVAALHLDPLQHFVSQFLTGELVEIAALALQLQKATRR